MTNPEQLDKEIELNAKLAQIPHGSKFAFVDYDILMHGNVVATARSKTMARRITNALNDYLPNQRSR